MKPLAGTSTTSSISTLVRRESDVQPHTQKVLHLSPNKQCQQTEPVARQNDISIHLHNRTNPVITGPLIADPVNSGPGRSVIAASSRLHGVSPSKQWNSSEFMFSKSLLTSCHKTATTTTASFSTATTTTPTTTTTTTSSDHKIANNFCPTNAKAARHLSTNVRQSRKLSNADSLPEMSVDFDATKLSVSRHDGVVTLSSDFCESVDNVAESSDFADQGVTTENCSQNEPNITTGTVPHGGAISNATVGGSDVVTSLKMTDATSACRSSLESLLGKERLQRLMNNLRDIDLAVSDSASQHHRHHHHLSDTAADLQCQPGTFHLLPSSSLILWCSTAVGHGYYTWRCKLCQSVCLLRRMTVQKWLDGSTSSLEWRLDPISLW